MNIPKSKNQYIEFKSERVSAKVLSEEIVAFANAEGGEIWLGVEDEVDDVKVHVLSLQKALIGLIILQRIVILFG